MSPIALTRAVPPSIARCELTHLQREPVDFLTASRQHTTYEGMLAALGCEVRRLPSADNFADSVFVEDTAVVLDEIAIITRPGAESRRRETPSMAAALAPYRRLVYIEAPATLDGGDVLRIGKELFVGLSTRTNSSAVEQLQAIASPLGYTVTAVEVRDCLHLKSAVTALPDDSVVVNPDRVDASLFPSSNTVEVDPSEPDAANVLTIGKDVICSSTYPRTRQRLADRGYRTHAVDLSELAKAEGALTCCSLILSR